MLTTMRRKNTEQISMRKSMRPLLKLSAKHLFNKSSQYNLLIMLMLSKQQPLRPRLKKRRKK